MWTPELIGDAVKKYAVIIFGRGSYENPFDGHTKRALEVLIAYGIPFELIDITKDETILNALVQYSGWSLPQVFINGRLIGGSDALLELHENGELSLLLRNIKTN